MRAATSSKPAGPRVPVSTAKQLPCNARRSLRPICAAASRPGTAQTRRLCAQLQISQGRCSMADEEPINSGNGAGANPDDSEPQVVTIAQYVKDLSVENPSSPQAFQWQAQPQLDVQFNINVDKVADDIHEVVLKIEVAARVRPGRPFPHRSGLCRPVRAAQHPRGSAAAVPADRSAAPAVPVRPPDHRRRVAERRLPAAAARPDRLRRAYMAQLEAQQAAARPAPAAPMAARRPDAAAEPAEAADETPQG